MELRFGLPLQEDHGEEEGLGEVGGETHLRLSAAWYNTVDDVERLVDLLGLEPAMRKRLSIPFREVSVQVPVLMDDGLTPARVARWDSIEDQYGARRHAMSGPTPVATVD